jgi:hypothetical protein
VGVAGLVAYAAYAALRPKPTQLSAAGGIENDTIVVNTMESTRLHVSVLDQRGRLLPRDTAVQFRLISGDITLSPTGETTCSRRVDAVVQAAFARVERPFVLHCRPVVSLESPSWIDLLVGDRPHELSFVAHGPDGAPVTELRGTETVENGSVAGLVGTAVRARRPGMTFVHVVVGNRTTSIPVQVYQIVTSFVGNAPNVRLMALRVRLARGDTIVMPVPKAAFWVKYFSNDPGGIPPTIELRGKGSCTTGDGMHVKRIEAGQYAKYCLAYDGTTLMIAHGGVGADIVNGTVAMELEWQ